MSVIIRLSFFAVIFTLFTAYAKNLDTSSLGTKSAAPKAKPSNEGNQIQLINLDENYLNTEMPGAESEEQLNKKIEAMKQILINKPNPVDKVKLHSRNAALNLKLADILKENKDKQKSFKRALRFARKSAEVVVKSKRSNENEKAVGHYLLGMALIFADKPVSAIKNFQSSLKISPQGAQALPMLIFLGEYYFGSEKFSTAKYFYEEAIKLKRDKYKNFVTYKLAWSNMNLKKYKAAEELFLRIVKGKLEDELFAESMTDLAFLEGFRRQEKGIIKFYKREFKDDKEKQKLFVTKVSKFLSDQGNFGDMKRLIKIVLSYQKTAVEKIKILLLVMNNRKGEFATKSQIDVYKSIAKEIEKENLTTEDAVFEAIRPELIASLEFLIKSLSNSYNAKTKRPANTLSKKQSAKELNSVLMKYAELFSDSENFKVVINLRMSLCMDEKDYKCAEEVTSEILEDQKLQSLHEEATLNRIDALGELVKKQKKYKREYVRMMKEYAKRKERTEEWSRITTRLGALYQSENRHKQAIGWLRDVHDFEGTSESLYQLNVSRFALGQFSQLMKKGSKRKKKKKTAKLTEADKKLQELEREAALRLVIKAKKSGNFSAYEKNMKRFLNLNPEGEKAAIAVNDYLQSLLQKEDYSKVTEVFKMVPEDKRGKGAYRGVLEAVVYRYLAMGRFRDAYSMVQGVGTKAPEMLYLQILAKLGEKGRLDNYEIQSIKKLKKEHQDHVLELMTLGLPQQMMKFFWASRAKTNQMRSFTFLAIRLQQGLKEVKLNTRQRQALGPILPANLKPYPRTKTEKLLLAIRFPNRTASEADSTALVKKAAQDLATSRQTISNDLENIPLRVRSRVLETAIRNERKMARTLETAPAPSNLTAGQKKAYKQQVRQLAKQYYSQAQEYEKANKKVKSLMGRLGANKGFVTLIEVNEWPWPQGEVSSLVQSLVAGNKTLGALIVADFNFGQTKISKPELFNMRGGILLSRWPHWQGLNFVKQELKSSGQTDLIKFIEDKT